jgi:hypothetical protein
VALRSEPSLPYVYHICSIRTTNTCSFVVTSVPPTLVQVGIRCLYAWHMLTVYSWKPFSCQHCHPRDGSRSKVCPVHVPCICCPNVSQCVEAFCSVPRLAQRSLCSRAWVCSLHLVGICTANVLVVLVLLVVFLIDMQLLVNILRKYSMILAYAVLILHSRHDAQFAAQFGENFHRDVCYAYATNIRHFYYFLCPGYKPHTYNNLGASKEAWNPSQAHAKHLYPNHRCYHA